MIDIGGIVMQAVKIVWRHKFLWLLGLLVGLNGLIIGVGRLFLRPLLPAEWFDMSYWLALIDNRQQLPPVAFNLTPTDLIIPLLLLFVYVSLLWLVMTVAEGGIIATAVNQTQFAPIRWRHALRRSFGYLPRFAAIDALVFLPLFVLMLLLMALALVDTAVLAYLTLKTAVDTATAVTVYVIGWFVILGVSCCMLPLSVGGSWYRRLGFIDAALLAHAPKQAIRHTWYIIRQHGGELLALTVLLYGANFLLGWLFSFLTVPMILLTAVPLATGVFSLMGILTSLLNVGILLLVALLNGVLHAIVTVVWTLAYHQLTNPSPSSERI